MKRKIMIFVTILFVALAINGFAHNRHNKEHHKCPCPCEQRDFRPSKEFKHDEHRKGRPERKNVTTVTKDTINGKTAMVTVGNPLNQFQLEHILN